MSDCCANPCIATLHDQVPVLTNGRYETIPCINRLCTHCFTHWYGHPDSLTKYTKQEWDSKINKAFEENI